MEAGPITTYPFIPSIDFVSWLKKKMEAEGCVRQELF